MISQSNGRISQSLSGLEVFKSPQFNVMDRVSQNLDAVLINLRLVLSVLSILIGNLQAVAHSAQMLIRIRSPSIGILYAITKQDVVAQCIQVGLGSIARKVGLMGVEIILQISLSNVAFSSNSIIQSINNSSTVLTNVSNQISRLHVTQSSNLSIQISSLQIRCQVTVTLLNGSNLSIQILSQRSILFSQFINVVTFVVLTRHERTRSSHHCNREE